MEKSEYYIDRGDHFCHGKKSQPMLFSAGLLLVGIGLHMMPSVSIWYSILFYAAAYIVYMVTRKKMSYTHMKVVFDDTCLYNIEGPNGGDVNKLFGIGFGNHMTYSGRFGWTSDGKQFDIFAYVRNNGIITSKKMISCTPNEPIELTIKVSASEYEFTASKRTGERSRIKMERGRTWYHELMPYYLYPYFGGNLTAPHNMKLKMEQVF